MKILCKFFVFLFFASAVVQADEKDQKSAEIDVSIALDHYKTLSDKVTNHAGWPEKYFEGYPQCVTLPKEVNSLEDVTALLNDRSQIFKEKDSVIKVIERDGHYIVALSSNSFGKDETQSLTHLVKAYVIKKGTKTVFCWMNW